MKTLSIRNLILLIFTFFSINQSFGQTTDEEYNTGHYYDLEGVKHTGFISYSFNASELPIVRFKSDTSSTDSKKIQTKKIKSMVIYFNANEKNSNHIAVNHKDTIIKNQTMLAEQPKMVADSFLNINVTTGDADYPIDVQFCKFVTEGVQSKIYSLEKHLTYGAVGAPGFGAISGSSTEYKTTYLCEISGKVFELHKGNFIGLLLAAFTDDPDLLEKIDKKIYRIKDIGTIINEYKKFKSH